MKTGGVPHRDIAGPLMRKLPTGRAVCGGLKTRWMNRNVSFYAHTQEEES